MSENSPDIWKLHSMLPNKPCIKKEIKEEIRKYFELNENKTEHIKISGIKLNK